MARSGYRPVVRCRWSVATDQRTPDQGQLCKLRDIDFRVEHFLRLLQFVPRERFARISSVAAQHGAHRRFCSQRRLVQELATGDAGHKRLFLFGVGLVERAREFSRGGEFCPSAGLHSGIPGVLAGNIDAPIVVRLGASIGPEQLHGGVKGGMVELGGSEADLYVVRIGKEHVEVVLAISGIGADLAVAHAPRPLRGGLSASSCTCQ